MLPRLCSFVLSVVLSTGAIAAASFPAGGSALRADDYRVARIGYRIGVGAARHCPEQVPLSGLQFQHLAEFAPADRPGVIAKRRLDRGPGILGVVEGSPAAEAGLVAGDVLLAINDQPLSLSDIPLAARMQINALLEQALILGPARLRIERDGANRVVTLTSRQGCPARVRLARSADPTAVADRGEVVVTTALLGEVRNDDELAAVIGHELAHIVLRHAERLRSQRVPRGLLRGVGRNAARVRATEEEADRLGLRLAAAGGYDAAAAIPFWRRYYARYDAPRLFRTHPDSAARERLIREVLAELQAGAQRPELGKGALGER